MEFKVRGKEGHDITIQPEQATFAPQQLPQRMRRYKSLDGEVREGSGAREECTYRHEFAVCHSRSFRSNQGD
jgi:hypothetical protein